MVQMRDDVVLIDAAVLGPPQIWEASGAPGQLHRSAGRLHELQDTVAPRQARRSQHVPELRQTGHVHRTSAVQPDVQDACRPDRGRRRRRLPASRDGAGHVRQLQQRAQLDAAQATVRHRPGAARVFRNEITPQNWIFRTREFEQMEMEYFVPPADSPKWYEYWCAERMNWYLELGVPADLLRLRAHDADELSHYSVGTSDVEFRFPWGWDKLEGHRPAR